MKAKTIEGFSLYTITEGGKTITNTQTGKVQTIYAQKRKGKPTGYLYASLMPDDGYLRKFVPVHRLVAFAFIGPAPEGKPWINHIDGNKANNHCSNLEWVSISANIQHAYDTGLKKVPKGADHWMHGNNPSKETREKMSRKKRGVNHPKFKGYYVVDGVKYPSAIHAGKVLGITSKTVLSRCKNKPNKWANFWFESINK